MMARSHHSLSMDEPHHEKSARAAELSRRAPHRLAAFLLFVVWLILRALEPIILLFALVLLLAMVLNPIVVWLAETSHSALYQW